MSRRIGIFTDKWLAGGIEAYVVSLVEAMNRERDSIEILTSYQGYTGFDERLAKAGVKITAFYPESVDSKLDRMLKGPARFGDFLRANPYDLIHFNIYSAMSFRFVNDALKCGVKVIVHSHNSSVDRGIAYYPKLAINGTYRWLNSGKAVTRWACSDVAADWLFSGAADVKIMNNGIDATKFRFDEAARRATRAKLGVAADTFLLGNLGRMVSQKNQRFLLDLMATLTNDDVKLLLIGSGPMAEALAVEIDRLGLRDRVIVVDQTREPNSFYSAMDAFLLPSLFEGNPVSAIEAQCNGLPLAISDSVTRQADVLDEVAFLPLDVSSWRDWVHAAIADSPKDGDASRRLRRNDDFVLTDFEISRSSAAVAREYALLLDGA